MCVGGLIPSGRFGVCVYVGNEQDPGAARRHLDAEVRKHCSVRIRRLSDELVLFLSLSYSNIVLLSTSRYIRSRRHEMRSFFLFGSCHVVQQF